MVAAFALDTHDDIEEGNERAGLLGSSQRTDARAWDGQGSDESNEVPGAYDFERDRDYDRPPPGDPPSPTMFAQPNDIGNSNGQLPQPVVQTTPKRVWWRRLFSRGDYTLVDQNGGRIIGGGTDNDGVFSNVAAKPSSHTTPVMNADGNIHLVPEDSFAQKESPPSYADAQLDQAPSYNAVTTTIVVPDGETGASGAEETGGVATFLMHALISFFFQFIGFVMTHMMAVNHAGRCGSRAGLGATFIQFGLYLRSNPEEDGADVVNIIGGLDAGSGSGTITATSDGAPSYPPPASDDSVSMSPAAREWLSFFFMTTGWFILLHSTVSFWRAKRWERVINESTQSDSSNDTPTRRITAADVQRDQEVRRNLESAFGLGLDSTAYSPSRPQAIVDANGYVVVVPDRAALEEARLARDLRAAGLI